MYQNDHLKRKSKFLCIQSLVLEVNGLKQGYFFKIDLKYQFCPRKKDFSKKVLYLPYIFRGVT